MMQVDDVCCNKALTKPQVPVRGVQKGLSARHVQAGARKADASCASCLCWRAWSFSIAKATIAVPANISNKSLAINMLS